MLDHCPFDDFDAVEEYDAYLKTPLGYLRSEVSWRNLAGVLRERKVLPGSAALDAGCGTGFIARQLAASGYRTTGLDPSASMLVRAEQHVKHLAPEARSNLRWQQAYLEDAEGEQYAIIASHCVIEFIPNRAAALLALSRSLAPGGVLSILSPNGWAEPFHRALKGRFEVPESQHTYPYSERASISGALRSWYFPAELTAAVEQAGLTVIGFRGVRIVSDHLPPEQLADEVYLAELIDWECSAGDSEPFRSNARYMQLFAYK